MLFERWSLGRAPWIGTFVVCAGCGSSEPSGTAPKVTNLTVTPSTVTVGKIETLSGEFDFEDPDADLSQIAVTLKLGTQSTSTPNTALQNVAGQKSGKASFALAIQAPQAGALELHIVVYDTAGHASNDLAVDVTAQ